MEETSTLLEDRFRIELWRTRTVTDNAQSRIESLEQMDKLLLRAQVLQQDALQTLEKYRKAAR
jgi:hypothetical protein